MTVWGLYDVFQKGDPYRSDSQFEFKSIYMTKTGKTLEGSLADLEN